MPAKPFAMALVIFTVIDPDRGEHKWNFCFVNMSNDIRRPYKIEKMQQIIVIVLNGFQLFYKYQLQVPVFSNVLPFHEFAQNRLRSPYPELIVQ